MTRPQDEPLAIVGIGCLFPKAAGPGAFWANVKHGVDCISEVPSTHWNPADYFDDDPKKPDMTYARRGGFLNVVDFNPLEFGINPRDIEATDTTQLLGLVAAKQALTDAGIRFTDDKSASASSSDPRSPIPDPRLIDRSRVSVILGVTGTLELVIPLGARLGHPKWKRAMRDAGIPEAQVEDAAARIAESYVPWQENSFPGLLGNVVAGRIANRLDLGGTNCVVDAACASSLSAVHLAAMELQTGRADVVVTGGCDTFNDIFMFMCFSKTPALSPTGNARPFESEGDGTILGEGLGMVVLKRLSDAKAAGDTIYAVIRGIGSSSDGKGNAIYAPSAEGQRRCLRTAYLNAGVSPDTIELVEAHGTGTRVGDATEATALAEVYSVVDSGFVVDSGEWAVGSENKKDKQAQSGSSLSTIHAPLSTTKPLPTAKPRPWAALGSVKSQIGHTKAAAGAASLIKAALALHFKVLPPTIKVTLPVEPLRASDSPFYINTQMRPWLPRAEHPRRAALSAFGFGGSNFHAVLEEYAPAKAEVDWDGSVELVAFGAASTGELVAEVEKLEATTTTWTAFARAAEITRTAFDPNAKCRLAFAVHRSLTDLPKLLATAKTKLTAEPDATGWHTPEGAYFGRGPEVGSLAVLFPGQGSQAVGMLRDFACLFPEMLDSLAAANRAVSAAVQDESDARRLSDRIYPPTSFDSEATARNDAELRRTKHAQPALGAVSLGAWRVLSERFGVRADAVAGHSYGELVALAAAGRLGESDFFTLSHLRGRLMGEQRSDDPGSMLAVLAPLPDIERVLAAEKLDLVVANHNAPRQSVLSGATVEIERALKAFASSGLKSARLPVAAAFHSPFVSDASVPFRAALEGVAFEPGSVPVYSNTTAVEYPADAGAARELLANQLAKPVAFVAQIRAMAEAGVRTFLEIGPGSVLTRLTEAILGDAGIPNAEAFALDSSGGKRSGVLDLGRVLARLLARGHRVELAAWERDSRCRPAPIGKPAHTIPLTGANYVNPRVPRAPMQPTMSLQREATTVSSVRIPSAKVPGMSEAEPNAVVNALLMTQQSLAALQRMQEQTAALHKQFLESQEAAQRTLQMLVEQQQSLLLAGLGMGGSVPVFAAPVAPAPLPKPAPLPVTVAPAPAPLRQPVPIPVAPPAPKVEAARSPVEATLLAVVAEKTGYPVESLELSLSLDGDLGVDSIKRVEILSALQELLPDAPAVKPEHLGSLHTLQDIVNFLGASQATKPAALPRILEEREEDADEDVLEDEEDLTRTRPIAKHELLLLSQPDSMPQVPAGAFLLASTERKSPSPSNKAAPRPPAATPDAGSVLLQVVAEKTGYPVESLELSLSLDGDLGVDSIKRVEILSALQELLPDAPAVKPEHLGSLHTLQDIVNFLNGRPSVTGPGTVKISILPFDPGAVVVPATATTPVVPVMEVMNTPDTAAPDTEQVSSIYPPSIPESVLANKGSDSTRNPALRALPDATVRASTTNVERVDRSILQAVDLDMTTPRTRVPLPAGGEIWVIGDPDPFTEAVADLLGGHGFAATSFGWSGPAPTKLTGPLAGLVLLAPTEPGPESGLNRKAFEWLKLAAPRLRQSGRNGAAVFLTVARLDGAFGLAEFAADGDPTAGGLAGLTKTARHEWPEVYCKAVDLSPAFTVPRAAAAAVVDEVLCIGPAEVGVAPTHRCTLELARTVRSAGSQLIDLGAKDVILVTGGARGVTAEAVVALAQTYTPTLILTGRTPAPTSEPEWLAGLTAEADLKRAIAGKLGADAGPKQVGEQYARVIAQREIRRTLKRIAQTGARAVYFPLDITNGKAVADVLHQTRVKFGPVTAIVHGAGVLADKRIEELTTEQFDHVYSTKVDGLRNLLDLLANEELKAIVLFSSTTARFGRIGQAAYACANEVLNKTAQVEHRRRPACRVVSINWGPWDGGMVTPGLRKVFENEGIGLIPLLEGGVFLVKELSAAGKATEVVAMAKPRSSNSGVVSVPAAPNASNLPPIPGVSASGSVTGTGPPVAELSLAFERSVDTVSHPVLKGHVIDGRAVLPMALHLEWLAHAALHGNPGLVFHGFNDLRVTSGVQLDGDNPAHIRAFAAKGVKQENKSFIVPVELRGKRKDGRETIHSRAEIILVSALPPAPTADRSPTITPVAFPVPQAYRELLFHGPELQGIERIDGVSESAFIGTAFPAPAPAEWLQFPPRSAWVADPLVLDASFQMMILWTQTQHDAASLPCFAGRYRQFRKSFPADTTTVVIRIRRDDGKFARADIDYLDPEGRVIAQMQDYECIMEKALNLAFRKNQLAVKS